MLPHLVSKGGYDLYFNQTCSTGTTASYWCYTMLERSHLLWLAVSRSLQIFYNKLECRCSQDAHFDSSFYLIEFNDLAKVQCLNNVYELLSYNGVIIIIIIECYRWCTVYLMWYNHKTFNNVTLVIIIVTALKAKPISRRYYPST